MNLGQIPDMGDLRAHDVALGHLNARGFIQFHPLLAQRLNSFKAAIFLGHALYWSKYLAQAQPHRKGWFFMSAAQWAEATGLSAKEQTAVRSELTQRGLLVEVLAGRPAVLHYQVNLLATAQLLGLGALTWDNMSELFRSCIRFYKPLADICNGVSTGLYLSYLLQRQSFALRNPQVDSSTIELFPGEFTYRPEQARIALCLGIKAQRNAREKLKAAGFIREGRATNEVVATRVNLSAIASCMQAQGQKSIRKPTARRTTSVKVDLALIPAPNTPASPITPTAPSITSLSRSGLPQRQLSLFAPMGLAKTLAPASVDSLAADAPMSENSTLAAPTASASALLKSLFAPGMRGQPDVQDAAATLTPTAPQVSELSTDFDTSGNQVALLSVPNCLFVDPNLPFCRNYIEQGISRYLQTTTTPPVDNFARDMPSRCRRIEKDSENHKPETAVNKKNDAGAPSRAVGDVFEASGGKAEKTPVEPEIQSDCKPRGGNLEEVELHLPDRLDPSMRAGVLATIVQASHDLRQAFLDELAGHLAIPSKTIHNPIGWLHSLIRRYRDGDVVLAMAPQVAELRLRRHRHLERLSAMTPVQAGAELSPPTAEPSKGESEVQRTERQRLKELRASFQAPAKQGGSL